MNERVHYNLSKENSIYVYSLLHYEHICLQGYLLVCTYESQCKRKETVLIQTTLKKKYQVSC